VLDGGEYQRLGESVPRVSNFRLLAATNRDPSVLKEDLGARLKFHVEVPDLNARPDDIPLLAAHMMRRTTRSDTLVERFFPDGNVEAWPNLSFALVEALVERRYATHVRELDNLLWESIANSKGHYLDIATSTRTYGVAPQTSSAREFEPGTDGRPSDVPQEDPTSSALGPAQIQKCIDEHNGRLEEVWKALGLANRYVLRRLIVKHNLEVSRRVR